MLTEEQKLTNEQQYLELLAKLNVEIEPIIKYLDSVQYFEKPATAQYNGAYAGGLCEHALDLYNELAQLCNAYFPGTYSEEDIIKVSLFKDIYRAEMYEFYKKNVKNETTGQWEAVGAYRTKEERPVFGDLGFSSYMIAKNFISMSDEVIEAICYAALSGNYTVDIHNIREKHPLITLTTMAEFASVYFLNRK